MTWFLVAAGAVVALGAGVAVAARDERVAVGGALVALLFSPFLGDPLPGSAELAFRIVAGVLAGYLLVVAARHGGAAPAPPLGVPATVAAAAAAFAAGLGARALDLPAFGPSAALAAGLACLVVAIAPVARAGSPFRLGIALVLLLDGGLLVRSGLVGTPTALETLVAGTALAVLAGCVAVLSASAARAGGDPGAAAAPRDAATARLPVLTESLRPRNPRT